jgi:hypothetical protein
LYWRYSQGRNKWRKETCESVRRLKDTKLEDLVWIAQVNGKDEMATDEAVKEQVKVTGKKLCVTDFCIQKLICTLLQI